MRWALSSLNYTETIKTDTMVGAPYIFLCFPMPKVGSESSVRFYKHSKWNQVAEGLQSGFFPRNSVLSFLFKEVHSQSLTIRPFETVREPGGSPRHLTPRNENLWLLILTPSQPVISGSSKPGRWHFILGPLGRDRISQRRAFAQRTVPGSR